jgi:DNA gyrase subunit A
MRMVDLTTEAYDGYIKRREELKKEIQDVEDILNTENGIDKLIIAELRDGIKRFGTPRRSNVVPYKISTSSEAEGSCILQLSSDGFISRNLATNAEEEPIPKDSLGFACIVENDSSFIIIDDMGYHTFIRVKDLPLDTEVPVNRYVKKSINGNIVALLPVDIESNRCCVLISKKGQLKKIRISDLGASKKPCIILPSGDKLVRGVVLNSKTNKDLLVYTSNGLGQRLDPNNIKATSPIAKGGNGFKLDSDDEIAGVFAIDPSQNAYLLYTTAKAKQRLNDISYLPTRESKHDKMVNLITLSERDKLVSIIGCNKLDTAAVYLGNGVSEYVEIEKIPESTMSTLPKKYIKTEIPNNSCNVVKVLIK